MVTLRTAWRSFGVEHYVMIAQTSIVQLFTISTLGVLIYQVPVFLFRFSFLTNYLDIRVIVTNGIKLLLSIMGY